MCANSFFDRSFVYAAPTLWNALDLDIRLLPSDDLKINKETSLSEVLCKLILIIYQFILSHEVNIYIYIYIYIYISIYKIEHWLCHVIISTALGSCGNYPSIFLTQTP